MSVSCPSVKLWAVLVLFLLLGALGDSLYVLTIAESDSTSQKDVVLFLRLAVASPDFGVCSC